MQFGENEVSSTPQRWEGELKHLEQLQGSRQRLFLGFGVLLLMALPFAPADVVAKERARLAELTDERGRLTGLLAALAS